MKILYYMKYKYYYIINHYPSTNFKNYLFLHKEQILYTENLKLANKFVLLSKMKYDFNTNYFIYEFLYKGKIYKVVIFDNVF